MFGSEKKDIGKVEVLLKDTQNEIKQEQINLLRIR